MPRESTSVFAGSNGFVYYGYQAITRNAKREYRRPETAPGDPQLEPGGPGEKQREAVAGGEIRFPAF